MPDERTEKIFSSIVNDYLSTRVPGLYKYVRAIHVVKDEDDGKRIVGEVIYRVGNQWFVTPVFYLNGQLRGHELLWVDANKTMVPANDKWIAYLVSRKPVDLGEVELRKPEELGVLVPNMISLADAASKTASVKYKEAAVETLDYLKKTASYFDVRSMLQRYGAAFHRAFFDEMYKNASFAEAIKKHYDVSELLDIRPAEKRAERSVGVTELDKLAADTKQPEGSLIVVMSVEEAVKMELDPELTDEETQKLVKNDIVVRDKRFDDQVADTYKGDFETAVAAGISNNPEPGVRKVLNYDGTTSDTLVLRLDEDSSIDNFMVSYHSSGCNTKKYVVQLDTGAAAKLNGGDIYILNDDGAPTRDTIENADKIKPISELGNGNYKKEKVVVFSPNGTLLVSGYVGPVTKSDDNTVVPLFNFEDAVDNYDSFHYEVTVSDEIDKPVRVDDHKWIVTPDEKFVVTSEKHITVAPSLVALKVAAYQGDYYDLKLTTSDGLEWIITTNGKAGEPLTCKAAMATLIMKHSLREDDARELIKEAGAKSVARRTVKAAATPLMPATASGYDSTLGMIADYPTDIAVPDTELQRRDVVRTPGEDELGPADMTNVQRAADTGQKDVLDLAVLSALVKKRDPLQTVDEFLPDLVVAMDRVGKILFMLYWHGEAFAERYGKSDLAELEDTLRNTFEELGDLVLFLKRRSIQPTDSSDISGMGLDEYV